LAWPAERLVTPFWVVGAVVLTLAGCGGSGKREGGAGLGCARAGSPINLPAAFPQGFPFPAGTVIDKQRRQAGGFTVIEGFVPGGLEENQDYFQDELPKAGFRLGEGDAEDHEAETDFTGNGFQGHLKIHDIPSCRDVLTLQVVVARS
jgi:hypothetical protein